MNIVYKENEKNDVCGMKGTHVPVIQVSNMGGKSGCKTDCLVCGAEVDYLSEPVNATCHYCEVEEKTYFVCKEEHYVCNRCHSKDAIDVIENICKTTEIADPLTIAEIIMEHPSIHMHGPEHHALIPAVLVAAYQNYTGNTDKRPIVEAMRRGSMVPGGYCGLYGACAAGIGVGIAMCVLLEATPLTPAERAHANWATACTLKCIADAGGARCCKKSTRISLEEGMKYLSDMFDLSWYEKADFNARCEYTQYNKECDSDCRYRSEG
ncbi:DUF5714 domain-containing protein [Methanolobus sp. WCC4]|uniref:DUF5714 domain-containing protein n=1 Tax=Methanolobus sp. WCC4 TaxID=3125784 RepID=UPI0030F58981